MPRVVLPVPSVVGGISQQPEIMAAPDKMKDIVNFAPLPEVGLVKRPPTLWRTRVHADPTPATRLVPLDFGGDDKYISTLSHSEVKAYFRNGFEVPIRSVTRDVNGNITGGGDPDFAYMDLRTPQLLTMAESLRSAGADWTISLQAQDTQFEVGPASPLGFPDGAAGSGWGSYSALVVDAGGGNIGRWSQTQNLFLWGGIRKLSLYVNTADSLPGSAVRTNTVALMLVDPADGTLHQVAWDFSGGYTSLPAVSANTFNFVTVEEQLTDNDFRLGFIFDPDKLTIPGTTGNTVTAQIQVNGMVGDDAGIFAWGALLESEGERASLGPYASPPETIKTVAAGGTLFAANPLVDTREDAATTATTFTQVYGTRTFTNDVTAPPNGNGHAAGANETGVTIADAGYVFVKQTADQVDFSVRVVLTDSTGLGGTVTLTVPATAAATDNTENVATNLANGLNWAAANTDAGVGGNEARILEVERLGSVLKLETKLNNGETWLIDEITTYDGLGNTGLVSWHNDIDNLSDLPLIAQHDTRVRLVEPDIADPEVSIPQVILRFVAEAGSGYGKGTWQEGVDYGLVTGLDSSTLPHVLVRREDDVSGTVTGEGRAIYFEWAPHTWNDRLVGDDTIAPLPSFITPTADEGSEDRQVDAIGFHRNRLVLASGHTVAFSEVSRYGNFFRTTVETLPDSERIDVSSSSPVSSPFTQIFETGGRLFLQAKKAVMVVSFGDQGILSPKTIGIDPVYIGNTSEKAVPTAAYGGLFFAQEGDRFDQIRFLTPVAGEGFGDIEVTAEIPHFVGRGLATLDWSPDYGALFAHSRESFADRVVCLRVVADRNQLVQLAPTRFEFESSNVESLAVLGNDLFVLVDRGDGNHLESICLDKAVRDADQEWGILLDRRITEQDLTTVPTFGSGSTTITLPWDIQQTGQVQVAYRSGSNFGVLLPVTGTNTATPGAHTLTVSGDHTASELYIGERYAAYVEPRRPTVQDRTPTRGFYPISSADYSVNAGSISLSQSAYLDILVFDAAGTSYPSAALTSPVLNGETTTAVTLEDLTLYFAVASEPEHFRVLFRNDTHKPSNIAGLEWEMELVDRGARVGF